MTQRVDLTGQKIGRWTVLAVQPFLIPTAYLCVCDCGVERVVRSDSLRASDTARRRSRSCGCLHREIARQWMADVANRTG